MYHLKKIIFYIKYLLNSETAYVENINCLSTFHHKKISEHSVIFMRDVKKMHLPSMYTI